MRRSVILTLVLSLFSLITPPSHALEVIVDNSDRGCHADAGWTTDTTNCYGPDKLLHAKGSGTEKVSWEFALPPGWYRMDFRINKNSSCAMNAHYDVTHRDGMESLVINQRRTSSGWFILGGAYYFDGKAKVTLSDEFTTGTGVVADAVRCLSIFSFVHMSDSHVGSAMGTADTTLVANELKTLGRVKMADYGFYAPPPSFAIHTGDFTEYGQEYWDTFSKIFSDMPFPIYVTTGNHDSTWSSCREKIRALYGAPYYSFDYIDRGTKFHFVSLNSSIIQSPRGAFAREELDWLAHDLATLAPDTAIFLYFHHPIDGASDPKPYDTCRLLEILRPYNAVIIFYGHGHSFTQSTFESLRIVQGGSTYDAAAGKRGYNLVTFADNKIHIAKKRYGEPTAANGIIDNMTIPSAPTYPIISVSSPVKDSIQTSASVAAIASISGVSGTVANADVEMDGGANWRPMSGSGRGPYTANINLAYSALRRQSYGASATEAAAKAGSGAVHGRHWVRVRFTMSDDNEYFKMVPFWAWDDFPKAKWIVDLGASSLGMPAVSSGKVYVGANGGTFRCLNASDGSEVWKVSLPSDIVSSPAVADGCVIFGCGDSNVYCLDAETGEKKWAKRCSGPVYSSPTIADSNVYIGSIGNAATDSYLYSLNAATGAENWKFASYSIESKPCVLGDAVFFGDWNSYFYAVNRSDGALKWRYRRRANRYYSPADSWPVASASANRVFVADREHYMNAINISTGSADWTRSGVSSQSLTPDGSDLLLRLTAGNLERTTASNSTVWDRGAELDSAPVAPICNGNRIAVVNQHGLVTVLAAGARLLSLPSNAGAGSVEYQFQVSRSYQLHPVNMDAEGRIYASTYEGFLVCVTPIQP
jgi:hypothetical protein